MNTTTAVLLPSHTLTHSDWMRLAETEYQRMGDLITSLSVNDWSQPTDCPQWDVREMVAHVVGAAESSASIRESVRQMRAARRWCHLNDAPLVDGLSHIQVSLHESDSPTQLTDRYLSIWPTALRRRTAMPRPLRSMVRMKVEVPGIHESWTLGYLNDCIYTRDTWMHRIDLSRATQRDPELSQDHDGLIVAEIVSEWSRRHGQPFTLELTGPAGGSFHAGSDGPSISMDAIEFTRVLSGRLPGDGLLAAKVPF